MSSKLINVRLASADASKAAALMADGVELSNLMREAIREEYERRSARRRKGTDIRQVLHELDERYPLPKNLPPREVDTRDRIAVSNYIAERIQRKQKAIHKRLKGTHKPR